MNTVLDWIRPVSWWIGLDWIWKNGPMDISDTDCMLIRPGTRYNGVYMTKDL